MADSVARSLGHTDATLAHVAYRALEALGAHKSALAVLKNESSSRAQRVGASFALKRIHAPEVVDSLEKHLKDPKDNLFIHAFEILARLYYKEKDWDEKHWGEADTRGPYYEMSTWEQSSRILNILRQAVSLVPMRKWAVI